MNLYRFLIPLFLAYSCRAGPVVLLAGEVIGSVAGEAAAGAVAGGSIAGAFGVGASAVWYGDFVVINGALYYGSAVAGVGVLGVAGGAAGGAVVAVSDKKKSKSIMASIKSASKASASASKASASAHKTATHAPLQSEARKTTKAPAPPAATPAPAATSGIPPPPATPVSSLPPASRPSEVPAGVPEYNFRMCQYDIIKMGQNKQALLFDQPQPRSIRVDNIPPTCMVLSTVMLGNPELGPHPVPMGSASLQWNDIDPKTMNLIRQAFDVPPQ